MCDDRVKISYFDDINNQRESSEIFPINYDTTSTSNNCSSTTSMYNTASYHLNRINNMKNLNSGQRNSSIIDANESFLSFHKFPQMYFSMLQPSLSSSLSLKDTENFINTKNRYTSSTLMSSKMKKNQQQQQRTRKRNFIKGYNESSNNITANTSTVTKATTESGVVGVAAPAAISASAATTINNIKESESNHRKNDINETYKRKLSCVTLDSMNAKDDDDITKRMKYRTEKDEMFEIFQPWALKTYGDQAKTKTITHKKKTRILRALNGKEQKNLDTSKFRFWVKTKGFTTNRPDNFIGDDDCNQENCNNDRKSNQNTDLFVVSFLKNVGKKVCRKVAVVEEFFEIIYNVHVDVGGRGNRHAGQKRTYRIITETYAFLPREAVTKFLTACPTCKKNLRPGTPSTTNRFEDHSVEDLSDLDVSNNSIDDNLRQNNEISNSNNNQNDTNNTDNIPLNFLTERTDNSTNLQNYQKSYSTISNTRLDLNLNDLLNNKFRQALVQQPDPDMIAKCISSSSSSSLSESWLCPKYSPFVKNFLDNYLFSINNQIQKLNQIHYSRSLSQLTQSPSFVPFPFTETSNPSVIASKIDSNNSYFNFSEENSIPVKNNYTEFYIKKFRKSYSDPTIKNFSKISSIIDSPSKRCKLETNNLQIESNENESMDVIIDLTMNTSDSIESDDEKNLKEEKFNLDTIRDTADKECFVVDLRKVKPITSTYLKLTRSLGLNDKDALKIDDLETVPISTTDVTSEQNVEDPYALMKDADKLKLMLLAWNYQNSNAVRNGGEAPDLGVVGGLWAQYQNALALNAKQPSVSPVNRTDQSSPIENQDETNSSSQKDEDDISEDDSDDKLDQNAQDPERLKAFNMFVRLFVDENLDRMIPISKQPKEKIQAIIDSCARQFPEFCERSRKRIRTYLKSCRRNKKAREGWDNTSRPTPAHLTSVQAEQILAIACENESLNAKRMRVGLDPISQSLPLSGGTTNNSIETIAPSTSYPAFRTTPNSITTTTTTINNTNEADAMIPSTTGNCGQTVNSARSSPVALLNSTNNLTDTKTSIIPSNNGTTNTNQISSPLYRPADFTSPTSTSSSIYTPRSQAYTNFFQSSTINNATPTDLSMKQQQQQQQQQQQLTTTSSQPSPIPLSGSGISPNSRNPIVTHKLSANEITAARQVITAYRESAAFLLRTADQVEQLLLQQQ